MANEVFVKGTKEYYVVDLTDRLQQVDDITVDASAWKYSTYDSSGNVIDSNLNASPQSPMRILSLIDTTNVLYVEGTTDYRLFITITIGPETPKLGPFKFDIIAGH